MNLPSSFDPHNTTIVVANNSLIIYVEPAGNGFLISASGHGRRACPTGQATDVVAELAGGTDVLDWRVRAAKQRPKAKHSIQNYQQSGADIVNQLLGPRR